MFQCFSASAAACCCKGPLKYAPLSGCLFVSLSIWGYSADVYLPVNNRLHYRKHCQMLSSFFFFFFPFFPSALTPVRIFVQIKRCYDFTVSWQTARARLVVSYCSSRKAFMWVSPRLGGNSTCFYKSSPLRNTCTEQRLHCFLRSHIVKIERAQRQQQAGLLNHSSFLAPLGWLKSSCQKHSITTDAGRGERLTC